MADIDIAIIGGGVSGVYSAWRLKEAYPHKKIVVFEGSDRIGGRLLSVRPPGIKNMVAELGGMRILPGVQPLITKLIDKLNEILPAEQQIELYDFPVDQPENIAYLRGVYLRLSDFSNEPEKVPYYLSFLERGHSAGNIIINAIEQIVPGITDPNLNESQRRQMAQNASFGERPLWEQGFWNVLIRVISGEAYELGVDAGGYNSTLTNWNAADAIPWYLSDFGTNSKYKGFKKGFQEVPKSLAALFRSAEGVIELNKKIDGFDWKDGTFEVYIQNQKMTANSLILAMPRRSLDLLAPNSPPLLKIQDLIASVTPRPLFKLFTTYNNPWWLAAGVKSGRTVTDLPVRQTYYWPQDDGSAATDGSAMLMASYDDGTNIGFWDGLRPRRRQAWQKHKKVAEFVNNPFLGDRQKKSDSEWDKYVAPAPMVEEVARQLAKIHGLTYTPKVEAAAFRDWGDDPFGGGWNSWNIGVKSWEVKQKIIQPIADCSLYICGEAYSNAQGWVEGALETADMVLEHFGIAEL
ncbi:MULTISPECIES: flavin monoamine oxidase family protein [unclassified Tolypothrix]|uniref:flavin monoamine oxidase family protein n=1 Tax=unclassified Tolypothrix TaxID=2649714 RepID=UPI0005EAAB2C|nr:MULTISPECIES: FAD-dependent oxidoreductase [unclassified Tolypothrix]BAY89509.1 protoporphyrinogen oxidase [Microchaete diplosiphon NIES-3275]EKF02471.1 amine oxidase [Tolypothrix sp. PCC 7601]MBE9081539.1 FAD-dependent oxidoreductase [Tolypothrix sp. LEGE 11397]UYD23794.1 FAD-dependent oxidoreductase [Tolypothrix sp. PCC 7712]UYD33981.1 FAD-dependent oxidoreductase [Tolypothrix sp. PCC 7601]